MTPSTSRLTRLGHHLTGMLGWNLRARVEAPERQRQVGITAGLGLVVGGAFSMFNLLTPGMLLLGLLELLAVLCLLAPAAWLAWRARHIEWAELLVLLAALVIFGALIVLGGIGGTGLLWAYTAPFLAFFLKGQRQGWWYSLAFVSLVAIYFAIGGQQWPLAFDYPPHTSEHFLLSLLFYTLVAANFNLLRTRFEEKLALRVEEKTADANRLLDQMRYLATHDATTGLPNRSLMLEQLAQEIDAARTAGQTLAVCNLRLERLQEIGNVLGSEGADSVVRQVATQLGDIARDHGVLSRGRRDEFTLSYRLLHAQVNAASLGLFLAKHELSVQEQGLSLYIELTLGMALYPEHGEDAPTLLTKAEQALLQARRNAQRWTIYDAQQDLLFQRHHLLFGKLRDALRDRRLSLHFQPQVHLQRSGFAGAEALLRWHDPVEGMISPAEFIPVAEESGLIRPLTLWVLAEAMRECAHWQQAGLDMGVSINISAMNLLDPELPLALRAALAASGLRAIDVNLELTESCFMTSPQRAMTVLQGLREDGFRLSIDDYGTGYSSLAYLKALPLDELKIDQSFVRRLQQSAADQAIVASTIALAHNFALQVVAEGVEDEAAADWLRQNGCDIAQGYHFARPMPAKQLIEFLATQPAAGAPG